MAFKQADLLGALGDADQHDVHHADSADAEGEGADDAEQCVEADGEGPQHLAALDGVPLGRGLIVLGIEMVAAADHIARSQQGCAVQLGGHRLEDDHLRVFGVGQLVENFIGYEGLFVVGTFVHGVLDLDVHDADHFEGAALDQDRLAHGGCTLKDAFRGAVAQYNHGFVAGELAFLDVSALRSKDLAHGSVVVLNAAGRLSRSMS